MTDPLTIESARDILESAKFGQKYTRKLKEQIRGSGDRTAYWRSPLKMSDAALREESVREEFILYQCSDFMTGLRMAWMSIREYVREHVLDELEAYEPRKHSFRDFFVPLLEEPENYEDTEERLRHIESFVEYARDTLLHDFEVFDLVAVDILRAHPELDSESPPSEPPTDTPFGPEPME